jgi:hypothetical protein
MPQGLAEGDVPHAGGPPLSVCEHIAANVEWVRPMRKEYRKPELRRVGQLKEITRGLITPLPDPRE